MHNFDIEALIDQTSKGDEQKKRFSSYDLLIVVVLLMVGLLSVWAAAGVSSERASQASLALYEF